MRGFVLFAGIAAVFCAAAAHTQQTPRGQQIFERRCTGCHALDRDKEGPRLGGVYGRAAASVPSFEYSAALKKSGIVWNADSLDRWLSDPEKVAPGNDMAFHLENAEERHEIIDFLKHLP